MDILTPNLLLLKVLIRAESYADTKHHLYTKRKTRTSTRFNMQEGKHSIDKITTFTFSLIVHSSHQENGLCPPCEPSPQLEGIPTSSLLRGHQLPLQMYKHPFSPGTILPALRMKGTSWELSKLQSTVIDHIKKNVRASSYFLKYLVRCQVRGNLYGPRDRTSYVIKVHGEARWGRV